MHFVDTNQKYRVNTKEILYECVSNIVEDSFKQNNSGKLVLVTIMDRGKGIDAEILPRLFTNFATKSNQGTGLGLYIAKSIIEAHGGGFGPLITKTKRDQHSHLHCPWTTSPKINLSDTIMDKNMV